MLGFALRFASNGARAYSPRVLFTQGQQGAWYDPSDLSTLFQDAAGTIPVTGTGQPVGLMLDKRLGLVRGPELAPDPSFDTGTGWLLAKPSSGSTVISGGALRITTADGSYAAATRNGATNITAGKYYEYVVEILSVTTGSVVLALGGANSETLGSVGVFRGVILATSTAVIEVKRSNSGVPATVVVGSVSVRELPGNHAAQPTAASRPIFRDVGGLRYLECDGVDDGMVTGSIDFTGTDKMFVCAGVRKLSDAARATVLELGVAAAGSFRIEGPSASATANYGYASFGSIAVQATAAGLAAPLTNVLTGVSDIGTDVCLIRSGGALANSTAADQGTGNYGNYPFYLFRRGGTSLPFNGLFYGAIIAGAAYSASQIASAERYLAGKSGVTL